jgi:hypothetical protein
MSQNDEVTHDQGVSIVLDFRNASLRQLGDFSIADLKRGIAIMRYSALKIKGVYIVGARLLIRGAINAVLLAVSKAMRGKVHFVDAGNFKALHRDICNPETLPRSLGGEVDDVTFSKEWKQRLASGEETGERKLDERVWRCRSTPAVIGGAA